MFAKFSAIIIYDEIYYDRRMKTMIFWRTFIQSLKLPNKQAMFKLNRTGMDITVIYMFILLFFVSLPTLIHQITSNTGPAASLNIVFLLIYFFIFSYLPLTIIVFLLLSVIAYIGTWISRFLQRKLRFSLLWKMAAYLTTIPFLIYMFLSFFKTVNDQFLWFIFLYSLAFLVKVITVYPKRRKRNKEKNKKPSHRI